MSEGILKVQLTNAERVRLVCNDFQKLLGDLTFNCLLLIEDLTKKASLYVTYAPHIVKLLTEHVEKVKPSSKLPGLYLIDSIMKNLSGDYLQYFEEVVPVLFCHVFEVCVDGGVRRSLHKLRTLWSSILGAVSLYNIDLKCHSLDENWPVIPLAPSTTSPNSTIFVNRDFFPSKGTGSTIHINPAVKSVSTPRGDQHTVVKTTATNSEATPFQSENHSHPVASNEVDAIKEKRRQVLQAVVKTKERLVEEEKEAGAGKVSKVIGKAFSAPVVFFAGDKRSSPIECENKEKRPRLLPLVQRKVSLEKLREDIASLTSLPKDKIRQAIEAAKNMADELFKSDLLSRADYLDILDKLDKLYSPRPPVSKPPQPHTTTDLHRTDPRLAPNYHSPLATTASTTAALATQSPHSSPSQQPLPVHSAPLPLGGPGNAPRLHRHAPLDGPPVPTLPAPPYAHSQPRLPAAEDPRRPAHPHIRGPPLDVRGPPLDLRGLPLDVRGPPLDVRGPPLDVRGPPLDVRGPPLDARGPPLDARGPPLDSRGPPLDARGPPLDARGPPLESRGPHLDPRVPPLDPRDARAPLGPGGPQGPPPRGWPGLHPHGARSRSPSPHDRVYHQVPPPPLESYRMPKRGRRRHGGGRGRHAPHHSDPWYREPRPTSPWERSRPRPPPTHPPMSEERDHPSPANQQGGRAELNIPDLPLEAQALKKSYPGIVDLIYAGDICSLCGIRLAISSAEYSRHLDWHYQRNKKEEAEDNQDCRNWYWHPEDWMSRSSANDAATEDLGDVDGDEEGEDDGDSNAVDSALQSCRGLPEDTGKCTHCGEKLESWFDHDEEVWYYGEATRGPDQQVYHVTCFHDAKEMKVFSPTAVTPSTPARVMTNLMAKLLNHNLLPRTGSQNLLVETQQALEESVVPERASSPTVEACHEWQEALSKFQVCLPLTLDTPEETATLGAVPASEPCRESPELNNKEEVYVPADVDVKNEPGPSGSKLSQCPSDDQQLQPDRRSASLNGEGGDEITEQIVEVETLSSD